jgi:hypothetical protein
MRIGRKGVKIFKIRNRKGYAAICDGNLTEGRSIPVVLSRMLKAVRRQERRRKRRQRCSGK